MTMKFIQALMTMLLVVALAGCESKTDGNTGKGQADEGAATTARAPASEEPASEFAKNTPPDIYAPAGWMAPLFQ
jgi:hypothetical protein